ncbi:retrovirus-related pol polyprotein from transposon TNT 1-94 [Tanacetum coccineum]
MKAILRKDKCLAAIGERPAEVTDYSKWDEMDGNAIANLHLALAGGVLSSIEEKKNAKEIWDNLARLYEARSLHNKKILKWKLYALRMTESTSVTEHQHRLKFKTLNSRSVYVLELVHSDVWQAPVLSLGGAKYFVSFIDDYSRRCWVYPIKKKSDVFEVFKVLQARARRNQKAVHNGIHSSTEWSGRADEHNLVRKSKSNTGKPVNYSDLHIFGSPVYVMYNFQETTKLDPKSKKCLFLGYADGVKGYRLWDHTTHKVVISRDFVFMEDKSNDSSEVVPQHEVDETTESQAPATQLTTLQEALNNPDASFWEEAMQEEMEALHKKKTWELVPLPGGRKPIGNKWVYKIKRNGDDQVERYRARLVVKGYAQKEGIDFNEIFSLVV